MSNREKQLLQLARKLSDTGRIDLARKIIEEHPPLQEKLSAHIESARLNLACRLHDVGRLDLAKELLKEDTCSLESLSRYACGEVCDLFDDTEVDKARARFKEAKEESFAKYEAEKHRYGLEQYVGKRETFSGTYVRVGFTSGGSNTVLLNDIKASDGSTICDHLWLDAKPFEQERWVEGDRVEFTATARTYTKGYLGERPPEDAPPPDWSYTLDDLANIRKIQSTISSQSEARTPSEAAIYRKDKLDAERTKHDQKRTEERVAHELEKTKRDEEDFTRNKEAFRRTLEEDESHLKDWIKPLNRILRFVKQALVAMDDVNNPVEDTIWKTRRAISEMEEIYKKVIKFDRYLQNDPTTA